MNASIATHRPLALWRSLLRWGVWFFVATLVWLRAVDEGHSSWEMNEALEPLKVRVLMADWYWYRTMWEISRRP